MNNIEKVVDVMDLDDCRSTLEHINKELHNLTEGNAERLGVISNLCLLVREKITKLTSQNGLSESDKLENN